MNWFNVDFTNEIDAPVEEVFAFLKKVDDWSGWTGAIKKSFPRSKGDWCQGYKLAFQPSFGGPTLPVTVIEYEENRLIGWGVKSPVFTLIHRFHFEPLGKDRCRVRNHEFATGPLGILAAPLGGTIGKFDRQWAADLERHFKNRARAA